jgi:hypothetical protein
METDPDPCSPTYPVGPIRGGACASEEGRATSGLTYDQKTSAMGPETINTEPTMISRLKSSLVGVVRR